MPTSQARIDANRKNAAASTGPKTPEGKANSRRNGLKHGMTGQGIVLLEADLADVDRRHQDLHDELAPKSVVGAILVQQMAILSIRMEKGAQQEIAAIARNVRNAPNDFDLARLLQAEDLMKTLGENPRANLRRLKKSPEGINLLIEAWTDLKLDLMRDLKNAWTAASLVTAASLTGLRDEHARVSRIGALSRAIWGDFDGLTKQDGANLSEEARKAWARAQLVERIEQEVAELLEDYKEIDFATIAQDRAEAGSRALFDPSKEASLARRYESAATRGFFKALKELRKVEAEAAGRPAPPATAPASGTYGTLASSCDLPPADLGSWPLELAPLELRPPTREFLASCPPVRTADGQSVNAKRAIPLPV